jgi:hypothetical protein
MGVQSVYPGIRAAQGALATRGQRRLARAAGVAVGVAMFACALALWTVIPAAVLFVVPRLFAGQDAAYLVTLVGVAGAMVVAGRGLVRLNHLYCRLMGIAEGRGKPPAWRRPLCNDQEGRCSGGVLDAILVASVIAAAIALAVWLLFFGECYGGGCLGG